jgi:hypothetical protein
MLYVLLKALLDSHEAVAAVWIFGVVIAVLLGCLCVALFAALFHPDPKTKTSARGIVKMLLDVLSKGSGR